jgi:putative Mg2+ transporter-C (MgtC) family protein
LNGAARTTAAAERFKERSPTSSTEKDELDTQFFTDLLIAKTPIEDVITRLGVASVLGMVIGADREISGKAAGLRTHMLVSLAAASFTLVAFEMYLGLIDRHPNTNADPVRVVEAVVAGVAFLGAGAIIQGRNSVLGITTGAGIWLAGAIGMACGAGLYLVAALTCVFALVILSGVRLVEYRIGLKDKASKAETEKTVED